MPDSLLKSSFKSISPGLVESELIDAAGFTADPKIKAQIETLPVLKSNDIAEAVIYVLSTPPHVQVCH